MADGRFLGSTVSIYVIRSLTSLLVFFHTLLLNFHFPAFINAKILLLSLDLSLKGGLPHKSMYNITPDDQMSTLQS